MAGEHKEQKTKRKAKGRGIGMGAGEGRRNLPDWLAGPLGPTRNDIKIQEWIKIEFRKILVGPWDPMHQSSHILATL